MLYFDILPEDIISVILITINKSKNNIKNITNICEASSIFEKKRLSIVDKIKLGHINSFQYLSLDKMDNIYILESINTISINDKIISDISNEMFDAVNNNTILHDKIMLEISNIINNKNIIEIYYNNFYDYTCSRYINIIYKLKRFDNEYIKFNNNPIQFIKLELEYSSDKDYLNINYNSNWKLFYNMYLSHKDRDIILRKNYYTK